MTDTMHTTVAGDLRIGTWLSLGSPVAAELAALCGLAWVLLDLEHGSGSEADLLAQLVSLRGSGTLGVVRVAGLDAAQIGRVLDVIIDRQSAEREDVWIGRSQADAPDIDCVVYVTAPGSSAAQPLTGRIVPVEIVASSGYDLAGVPV
jgi:2-keto-3-deoxy-L-rhamnonate aldolase RhmA